MKNNILFFLFTGLLALYPLCAGWGQADTRYIHEELNKIQRCKNMALTRNQGMVVLYGTNGFIPSGIPNTLYDKLKDFNNRGLVVDDICLTENGSWFIVGDQLSGYGVPADISTKIDEMVNNQERITCVSFNDRGRGVVISDKSFWANDRDLYNYLVSLSTEYGYINSVCITNKGMIACLNGGYGSNGTVPDTLLNYLDRELSDHIGTPRYIKFSDWGDWFVADSYENYQAYF